MPIVHAASDEELQRLPNNGSKYEVVDGELRVRPAGWRHESVVAELLTRLRMFAKERRLGDVLGSNVLCILPSGNRRAPDVSFVAAGRLSQQAAAAPFPELAPDLVVEVLSPADSPRAVLDGVGEYLEAGVRRVWAIDADKKRAVVYRSLSEAREIAPPDLLEGDDVLPGFSCRLADLFE